LNRLGYAKRLTPEYERLVAAIRAEVDAMNAERKENDGNHD